MSVLVKVFPSLREDLDARLTGEGGIRLSMAAIAGRGGGVRGLVACLGIPAEKVGLVLVNGVIVRGWAAAPVRDGDTVVVSPPIGGG